MNKKFVLITVLVICMMFLVSCADKNIADDEQTSADSEIVKEHIYTESMLMTFPDLIGKSNLDLKEVIDGKCNVGSSDFSGVYIVDIETGINVFFNTYGMSMWQEGSKELGLYPQNPLNEQLEIREIVLSGAISSDIIEQGNIRKVFDTEKTVTYDIINKMTSQTAELFSYEGDYIDVGDRLVQVKPDRELYTAEYLCENTVIRVFFTDINGEMIADYIRITAKKD